MNDRLLIDTNIVIYALQGQHNIVDLIDGESLSISFITEIELLSWPKINDKDIQWLKKFITGCRIVEYSSELKQQVIHIRRNYNLKMSDAFVAASALSEEIPLLSADGVFSIVKEIQFFRIKPNRK
jgi:predicted nucleic acid-binding protein